MLVRVTWIQTARWKLILNQKWRVTMTRSIIESDMESDND